MHGARSGRGATATVARGRCAERAARASVERGGRAHEIDRRPERVPCRRRSATGRGDDERRRPRDPGEAVEPGDDPERHRRPFTWEQVERRVGGERRVGELRRDDGRDRVGAGAGVGPGRRAENHGVSRRAPGGPGQDGVIGAGSTASSEDRGRLAPRARRAVRRRGPRCRRRPPRRPATVRGSRSGSSGPPPGALIRKSAPTSCHATSGLAALHARLEDGRQRADRHGHHQDQERQVARRRVPAERAQPEHRDEIAPARGPPAEGADGDRVEADRDQADGEADQDRATRPGTDRSPWSRRLPARSRRSAAARPRSRRSQAAPSERPITSVSNTSRRGRSGRPADRRVRGRDGRAGRPARSPAAGGPSRRAPREDAPIDESSLDRAATTASATRRPTSAAGTVISRPSQSWAVSS